MDDKSRGSASAGGPDANDQSKLLNPYYLRTAKHIYQLRRERAEVFGENSNLFGEPAWDILLSLYIAFREGKRLIRTDAAKLGVIPQTTSSRALRDLEKRGLVRSERGVNDKRVLLESLTEQGVTLMEACLSRMAELQQRS